MSAESSEIKTATQKTNNVLLLQKVCDNNSLQQSSCILLEQQITKVILVANMHAEKERSFTCEGVSVSLMG